jgi:hypothetical protein
MAHYIAAVHMSGGTQHEHIAEVIWMNGSSHVSGKNSTADMVDFIENKKGDVRVSDGKTEVSVGVVRPQSGKPYLRTYKDKKWTDNLLAVTRY